MQLKYPPISPKIPHMLHGGDYNPDQWIRTPQIWDEDTRLMKLSRCNAMSVGIFSWVALEPNEGQFKFDWLDEIMDKLSKNEVYTILATPSGARPAWLSAKYPEVLRVDQNGIRNLHGKRHNHCFTSPVYRERTKIINEKLADRYKNHPALILWHISNEFGGDCHCELCQDAFRGWLKKKYKEDLDKLNHAWWTGFWSHSYTAWDQIQSPSYRGEDYVHGHNLDWKRFVTDQTTDFFLSEIEPLRKITPEIPVTTNFMGTYPGLNYWKLAPHCDVISWDSYPTWHSEVSDSDLGSHVAFLHDINRSLKQGKPFMLMESTPSMTNWQNVAKLKRPGMHLLSSLQAVAHGSDTVQYFQWRKSRGSCEKFHGAVVDHVGHENTRVFREVTEVGKVLEKLSLVVGTIIQSEVAVIYDWENRWAIDDAQGPRREKKDYQKTCESHYRPFWRKGVNADVIDMDSDFSKYKLLIAPMLYMVRPNVAERIERFVENGGTFVATYWSGITDENDLCFLGGFPGPLRNVLGIWSEEIDALYDSEENRVEIFSEKFRGVKNSYVAKELCDLIHAEKAEILGVYSNDFYAGRPALTLNNFGKGKAYYIAFRNNETFVEDFYSMLIKDLEITKEIDIELPEDVTVSVRTDGENSFRFLMNFSAASRTLDLKDQIFTDIITNEQLSGKITLKGFETRVLVSSL